MAYRIAEQDSETFGLSLQQQLNQSLPGWKFPIRHGPIGVLASATMPAVAIEVGNLNNDVSVQTLTDPEFQIRLAASIAGSVEQFVAARSGGQAP